MGAMKKWFVFLLFIVLASCQSDTKNSQRVLRMNISREPPTMDPRKGSEWIGSAMHFLLFEGLMRLNPDGTLTPAQALSVELSDDRKTYTFHLRGTRWSDGSAVTAHDFEHAWKKIIDPNFGAANAHLFYPIKNAEKVRSGELPIDRMGVTAKDNLTLIVELEKPTPYFLELISFCVFFPVKHTLDEKNPSWMNEVNSDFVSNGPFTLKSWQHNSEIVFQKNQKYWEAPLIDLNEVRVSMISDEHTALGMFQKGQLDIIGMVVSPIPTDALYHFYKEGAVKNRSAPATTFVSFNTSRYPFSNKHIRKALSYAIDRSQIVENVTQLGEDIATGLIPPCLTPRTTNAAFQDHDLAQARKELMMGLKELGIKTLPPITLQYTFSELNHKIAQVLQEQWKDHLGIDVVLEKCENKTLLDRLASRSYDLATANWFAQYKDPMSILERFKSRHNTKNYPDWENAEYARLLERSALDESPEKRAKTLALAEALLLEDMPLAPLYHWQTSFMMKDHIVLEGLQPNGSFDYSRIQIKETSE